MSDNAFGDLLRRYRVGAGLSQEALAERAGLSARGISDLERGLRQAPRAETIGLLATALGLSAAERAQLAATAVRARPRSNLPLLPTSFIGRRRELAELRTLLATTRLLTLTGAGGCGKTRLALELARTARAGHADGVWLVELATLDDPALVPAAVARALGVTEAPDRSPVAALTGRLGGQRLLLVLDNCEHLLDAVAGLVIDLLAASPGLRVLTTSRARLGVPGEFVWRVPPLGLPPIERPTTARLAEADAVGLLQVRAREAGISLALTEAHAADLARICHRLEGLPLALELAAARLATLSPAQLADRLDDQLGLLVGGYRTAPVRQQTLRATLDWSYALLAEPARALLRRLAVFVGGWTLEAADAICTDAALAGAAVLGGLAELVEQSLVIGVDQGAGRFRFLEPVRQYAAEQLRAANETEATERRWCGWYARLVAQAEPALRGADQFVWLARLDVERDNLRAVLTWCLTHDPPVALQVAAGLWHYWRIRGDHTEGRRWLERALDRTEARTATRAAALWGLGVLTRDQANLLVARSRLEESLDLFEALNDDWGVAQVARDLGRACWMTGETARGLALLERGVALGRMLGDPRGTGLALLVLSANMAEDAQALTRQRAWLEESLALLRAAGDAWGLTIALGQAGELACRQGDYDRAAALLDEGLTLSHCLGERNTRGAHLQRLGAVAYCRGDLAEAATILEQALALAHELHSEAGTAESLRLLGLVALAQGDLALADARLAASLELADRRGHRYRTACALRALGLVARRQSEPGRAVALLRESLHHQWSPGYHLEVAECLEGVALAWADQDEWAAALGLLGAAAAAREQLGAPAPAPEQPAIAAVLEQGRARLGEAAFQAAWTAGWQQPLAEAVTAALHAAWSSPSTVDGRSIPGAE